MAENKKSFTDNGKELKVFKVNNTSLYEIKWADGGVMPEILKGRFTSVPLAEKAIEKYCSMTPKEKREQYEALKKKEESVFSNN